ncbi:MAG: hypothetical protein QG574_3609 [Cyanobacteriota bacterium erpe_2018_sw_21hr_WHONDRS-SW48-000092_B_bin.40]|jgi:hypothetical protein|nr:hypothetical protein [Cyanobacteriota bacterium erpe_2018_sw_21hr_WHONDRS-SW48-000092_B_bin.40]
MTVEWNYHRVEYNTEIHLIVNRAIENGITLLSD